MKKWILFGRTEFDLILIILFIKFSTASLNNYEKTEILFTFCLFIIKTKLKSILWIRNLSVDLFIIRYSQWIIIRYFENCNLYFLAGSYYFFILIYSSQKFSRNLNNSNSYFSQQLIQLVYIIFDLLILNSQEIEFILIIILFIYYQLIVFPKNQFKMLKRMQKEIKKQLSMIINEVKQNIILFSENNSILCEDKKFNKEFSEYNHNFFNKFYEEEVVEGESNITIKHSRTLSEYFLKKEEKNTNLVLSKNFYQISDDPKMQKNHYKITIFNILFKSFVFLKGAIFFKRKQIKHGNKITNEEEFFSQIFNTISHYLLTPLNGILGTERILKSFLSSDGKTHYRLLKSCSQILLMNVYLMFDFSLLLIDKLVLKYEFFDVVILKKELLKLFEISCKEKGLTFSFEIDPNLPNFLESDYLRLKLILFILISNSIKYTNIGYLEIKIKYDEPYVIFFVRDSGEGIYKSEIGKIFEENYTLNFNDNIMINNTLGSDKRPIGLIVIQKLIKIRRSNFWVESKDNHGTLISFPLQIRTSRVDLSKFSKLQTPRTSLYHSPHHFRKKSNKNCLFKILSLKENSKARRYLKNPCLTLNLSTDNKKVINKFNNQEDEICNENASEIRSWIDNHKLFPHRCSLSISDNLRLILKNHIGEINIVPNNFKKEKNKIFFKGLKYALIVDDEPFNRKVLKAMIESISNLQILEAANGIESIQIVKKNYNSIILIFMDINMPLMNGIEATINIKKMCFENINCIPIIAVTAFSEDSQKNACFNSGMDLFINKPVKVKDLYEILLKYSKQ